MLLGSVAVGVARCICERSAISAGASPEMASRARWRVLTTCKRRVAEIKGEGEVREGWGECAGKGEGRDNGPPRMAMKVENKGKRGGLPGGWGAWQHADSRVRAGTWADKLARPSKYKR